MHITHAQINVQTGEEIITDFTAEEIAQMKIDADNFAAKQSAIYLDFEKIFG